MSTQDIHISSISIPRSLKLVGVVGGVVDVGSEFSAWKNGSGSNLVKE